VSSPGVGVDSGGSPVKDPTDNVMDLVVAAMRRQDDLRSMESSHLRELVKLRAAYEKELRRAESARIDAIRAVDVAAVQRAGEVAATQASVLAAQVQATAEASRTALIAALEPIQKAIEELRRSQYEGAGAKIQTVESRESRSGSNALVTIGISALFAVIALASLAYTVAGG
jgi:hypothetical protein